MSRFAQYYIKYHHEFAPYDWEDRQKHLGALFETDESIVFGEGEPSEKQIEEGEKYAKTYNLRVYHLQNNPHIVVMQFANSIDIPVEIANKPAWAKDEPSCFVIIDNRENQRTVIDEPVAETLDAMHHYRDAIYYGRKGEQRFSKEIIGGYILFPGRMDERQMLERMKSGDDKLPYYLQSIEKVNIGAYPLLPNEESGLLLEDHLRRVLLDETILEQLEDSVPQRGLYYTDTRPKAVESRNVFTVSVRKTDADYETFRSHKAKKFLMESLPKVNVLEAVYLLPMVGGEIDGYYKIKGLTIEDGKMCFKLGEFTTVGELWVNIYQKMRHGELITMDNVIKLYKLRI